MQVRIRLIGYGDLAAAQVSITASHFFDHTKQALTNMAPSQ